MSKIIKRSDFEAYAFVGDKRQGKTSLAAQFARAYDYKNNAGGNRKHPRRVLIHDPTNAKSFEGFQGITLQELKHGIYDEQTGRVREWTRGIRRLVNDEDAQNENKDYQREVVKTISAVYCNGLLLFDEATTWIDESKPPPWQKKLLFEHANFCIDVGYIFLSLMAIPRTLRKHIWNYYLFKIPDEIPDEKWFVNRQFPNSKGMFKAYCDAWNSEIIPQRANGPTIQKFFLAKRSFGSRDIKKEIADRASKKKAKK